MSTRVAWIANCLMAAFLYSSASFAAEGDVCGGIAGGQCAADEYCAYELGQCPEDVADLQGKCAKKPEICTEDFTPVCGCDGNTYSNACKAAAAGVSVKQEGECPAK